MLAKLRVDEKTFNTFIKKYQKVANPELKSELRYALALTHDAKNIETAIQLLAEPEIIKPQDHSFFFYYLRTNHLAKKAAFEWLTKNWDYVEKMAGEKMLENYIRYTAYTVKTKDEADEFFGFFEQFKEHPVMKRSFVVATTEINARLKLIEADREGVYQKLQ